MNRDKANELDQLDPLAYARDYFALPTHGIYLCGHSLGAMPANAPEHLASVTRDQWGKNAISAWNNADWINMPQRLGRKMAKILGANAHEVIISDSTSINLFKLIVSALSLRPDRHVILTEKENFPADLYMADGITQLLSKYQVIRCEKTEIANHLNNDVALLMLTHVDYRSSEMHDMAALTAEAHHHGALVLFDLAHSVGAVPLSLNECQVDFAVGSGYKYLNGGPGAPAFLFVAERHLSSTTSPLQGWMGHQQPFAFSNHYEPATDIKKFLCGTPPILSMAALENSIDIVSSIDIHAVKEKTDQLAELMIELMALKCPSMTCISPKAAKERGGHLGFFHQDAYAISRALLDHGVIADFRAPNLIRFGLPALYLRYVDIYDTVATVSKIINTNIYHHPRYHAVMTVT
jgi:kynureninase